MENCTAIQCPFCGQTFELMVDTSERQQFVTDCEVCCRPLQIKTECESGELVSIEVSGS